ncbi:hypothetical protein ACFO5O_05655 [Geojedonia litorea]|uniref:Uncharacterized protein n=1 Tax=Geojedonia litorea TaxID=1268269 RepID=A0ABV9N2Y5_9FLAO
MKQRTKILFFILEIISGIAIGIIGMRLITPEKPIFDLNLSIILGFLSIYAFALIGIGIPGYFHSRIIDQNKTYGTGIKKAAIGLLIGMVLGLILSAVTSGFLPHGMAAFTIPVLTTILCGVIGFNKGIKTFANKV